jgi:DNA polymerase
MSGTPSPPDPDAAPRNPADTLRELAGLAEHLQRIGIQWLPQADPQTTARLAAALEETPTTAQPAQAATTSPAAVEPSTQSSTTPPASTPPASTPPASTPPAAANTAAEPAPLLGRIDQDDAVYPGPSLPAEQRGERLAAWAETVSQCTRCEVLAKCRNQTVFGEGNVTPRVVFFGEGPGRDEDLSGRPFVGKAGQLLTKMIQACKFDRQDVYIMNTVKCRPPNNRNPEPSEVENCREYFEAQLNLLRPEYIVCLGLVSAQALLRTKLSVGRMRGKLHRYRESKVLVTYHPSYLLRTPAAKKAAWQDLQLMLRDAGLM